MPKLTKKFKSDDWRCDYDMLDEGGLALGNVMHDGFHLAKDIRVVRVWVNAEDPDPAQRRSLRLGKTDFELLTTDQTYLRYRSFNAPPPFDIYKKEGARGPAGMQAVYRTRAKLFGQPGDPDDKDPDDDYLTIEQSYIFTKYGTNPSHEPLGILPAAHFFPLIKFSYGGKKVRTIRFDYRFHVSLDILLGQDSALDPHLDPGVLKKEKAEGLDVKEIVKQLTRLRPMLAGIFRDEDKLPPLTKPEELFFAVEKPVLREVVGYGLKRGLSGKKVSEKDEVTDAGEVKVGYEIAPGDASTWDNIHMWSNRRLPEGYVKRQASTPGAFHAFHCHWRWPYFAEVITTVFLKEKQFRGLPMKGHFSGPLLDPRIPKQTIQLAITLAKPPKTQGPTDRWDADACPSERVFEELFITPESPSPRYIGLGEELLTWLSISAESSAAARAGKKKFEGTLFTHGLFFAHNPEPYLSPSAATVGQELQQPKYAKPTWRRSPNGK
jgi:hypothetical protein